MEPATWPETLTRRWRVEVGDGYASPLIVGPTVFVFSRQRRTRGAAGARCRDRGRALAVRLHARLYTQRPTAAHGAGPKATPLAHEGKVFTHGISGIVAAFDAQTGMLLWRTDAPAEAPYFSAASSPLGLPGAVVVHPGNYDALTAFDASTGAVKWRTGAGGFFMSPVLATLQGVPQVLSVTQAGVMSVSASDGRMLWEYAWPGARQGGIMPTVHGNEVVVSAAGSGVLAVRPTMRNGAWTVEKVWETAEAEMYLSHPVVVGETLYGFSTKARGQLFALDLRDGHTRWLGPPRQATNVAVTKAGNFLLLLEDDGELIVAWADNNAFDPVKRYRVGESATWAQPVVSGRRILIRDGNALTMWDVRLKPWKPGSRKPGA